jgi:hypothetical protein
MSWSGLEKRGNLGEVHQTDYERTILPLTNPEKGSTGYSVYRADLSTVALKDYTSKITINHVYPKPGYTEEMEDAIMKLKKTWEASGQSVAVYEVSASGPQQYVFVTRYKEGLKEREIGYRRPMKERFNNANGIGAWDAYIRNVRAMVDHSWSEMLFYHPELSSK